MSERRRMIRLVWINTIIVVLLVGLIVGGTYYFASNRLAELRAQLDSLTQRASAMAAKQQELPTIRNRLGILLAESRKLNQLLPNNPAQKELVTFLQQNVDGANCEVVTLDMKSPDDLKLLAKTESAYTEMEKELDPEIVEKTKVIETNLSVRGGFVNLLAFVENMKRSGRFFLINRISAPERRGGTQDVFSEITTMGFELRGEFYYTTAKVDIAERFDELKESLEEVLPARPIEEVSEEKGELITIAADGSEMPVIVPEEEETAG